MHDDDEMIPDDKIPPEFEGWPDHDDDTYAPVIEGSSIQHFFSHYNLETGERIPEEEFNEQEFYEDEIEPRIKEIRELCEKNNIPMVFFASFRRHILKSMETKDATVQGEGTHFMSAVLDGPRAGPIIRCLAMVGSRPQDFEVIPKELMTNDSIHKH